MDAKYLLLGLWCSYHKSAEAVITTLNISNSVVHIDNEFLKTLNNLQHLTMAYHTAQPE